MRAFRRTTRRGQNAGITLLELLIVMVIMLMITAAAIPIIAPATRNRQMRESTRLVSSYLGAARARAVQTGRPAGVMIERFNPTTLNGGAFALQMSQIEMPPPYSGDIVGSKATVAITIPGGDPTKSGEDSFEPQSKVRFDEIFNSGTAGHTMSAVWFGATMDGTFNNRLVRVGDQIQFGGQGHVFTIYGPDTTPQDGVIDSPGTLDVAYVYPDDVDYTFDTTTLAKPLIDNVRFPWANAPPLPVPQATTYQIFRQPVRTSTPPLVLPEGIVVDLSVSGVGSGRFNTVDYTLKNIGDVPDAPYVPFDPQIIFSPSGRLDYVTLGGGVLARPTDPVFLLMGRRELMFDVTNRGVAEDIVFQNLGPIPAAGATTPPPPAENFWVTIGYQSGLVTVSEVAPNFQDYENNSGLLTTLEDVINLTLNGNPTAPIFGGARDFAKQSQSVGGR